MVCDPEKNRVQSIGWKKIGSGFLNFKLLITIRKKYGPEPKKYGWCNLIFFTVPDPGQPDKLDTYQGADWLDE